MRGTGDWLISQWTRSKKIYYEIVAWSQSLILKPWGVFFLIGEGNFRHVKWYNHSTIINAFFYFLTPWYLLPHAFFPNPLLFVPDSFVFALIPPLTDSDSIDHMFHLCLPPFPVIQEQLTTAGISCISHLCYLDYGHLYHVSSLFGVWYFLRLLS